MADCRKCKHNYKMPGDEPRCNRMCDVESDFESITKADIIRAMSDEELAVCFPELMNFARETEYCAGVKDWLEWLQSEAE